MSLSNFQFWAPSTHNERCPLICASVGTSKAQSFYAPHKHPGAGGPCKHVYKPYVSDCQCKVAIHKQFLVIYITFFEFAQLFSKNSTWPLSAQRYVARKIKKSRRVSRNQLAGFHLYYRVKVSMDHSTHATGLFSVGTSMLVCFVP